MKKILSMVLSLALLTSTFTTIASADELEKVGDSAPAYADYVAGGFEGNFIKDPDNLSDFTRGNGAAGKHYKWESGTYASWIEKAEKVNTTWYGGPSYYSSAYSTVNGKLEEGKTYVVSVILRNDTTSTRPTLHFGLSVQGKALVSIPVTSSEYKLHTGSFVMPKDATHLCVGFDGTIDRSGLTDLGIINMDISNGGSLYVGEAALHDINVEAKSATTVEQRGTVNLSASLVNQIDEEFGAQNFNWYVVNTERTEKIATGFTFSSQSADTTLTVAKDVTPGKYVVMAESTADSKFKKGIEIEVTKEILRDNGSITLTADSGVAPSYDIFADFSITAGNIEANDINWFAVKENRMDVEDKITITPTTGTSAKVTLVDGIEDGTYYLVAQSKADDSKRKMLEIVVDNSQVRDGIISDFNSGSTTAWESKFEKYVVLIGEDTESYKEADKAEILKLIVEQSKVEAFTSGNLSELFKGIVALSLYNKNTNGVELNDENGAFNFEADLGLDKIDQDDVTVYDIYKNSISEEGQKKVIADLTGKDFKTVAEFKEAFIISTILNAIAYPNVLGFQYVGNILTAENMAVAKINKGLYLSADDNSGYNKELARKIWTKSQLEAVLAREIDSVPEEEIYDSGDGERTEIEIPIGTEGSETSAKKFSDVPDTHWAYSDIYFLTELGVISGVSDDLFNPDGVVTREVAAKIISKAFNLKATGEAKNFTDVDPNAWYAESIRIASSAGVVNGVSDTEFGVGAPVTRQDLCVMITRALKAELSEVEALEFSDTDTIAEYARKSVAYLNILSIIGGYNDNTFRPYGNCKRSEIAKIISRTLNTVDLIGGSDDDELVYSKDEELLFGIGAVDIDKYMTNANVTRAGLAEFINDTCIREEHSVDDEWENNVMTDGMVNINDKLFDDIDESHVNYYDIEAVVKKNYMGGISDNLFAPDIQVNLNFVVKTLLDILGYSEVAGLTGGYSEGYVELARSLGLLDGVYGDLNSPARYKDVVKLFANAMKMGKNKIGSIEGNIIVLSADSNKTFMTEVMNIDVVEGILTDNGITSLSGQSKIERNKIVVGGHKLDVPEELNQSINLIGKKVRAYYDCSDESKKVLIYLVEAGTEEYYEFQLKDFLSFDGKTLSYEENNREKNITIGAATVIYNGTIIDTYDESLFIDKNGDVTVLSVYEKNDYIIVNDYKDFFVSKVSHENKKIYNSLSGSDLTVLNLKKGEDYENVNIFWSNGDEATFDDIIADQVLAVKANSASGIIDIYIHDQVIYNTLVKSTNDEEIVVAEGTFETSPSFKKAGLKLEAGKSYNLHFNQFGEIVNAEIVQITEGRQMGILTRAISNEDEEVYAAKIYDQNKAIVLYNYAERVNINDNRVKKQDVEAQISAYYGEPIFFTVTEGVITDIITPESAYGADEDRGLFKIIEPIDKDGNPVMASFPSGWTSGEINQYKYDNWYLYRNAGDGASFGGKFSYDKNKTKVYVVPANSEDYSNPEKFSINVKTFSDHSYHMVDAYAFTQGAVVPDVIIAREEAKRGGSVETINSFLITSVTQGLTADDEVRSIVQGYKITNKEITLTELPVADNVVFLTQQKNVPLEIGGTSKVYLDHNTNSNHTAEVKNLIGNVGPRTFEELNAGDIFRYSLNSDGEIATVAVSYDRDIDDDGHINDGKSQSFEPENIQCGTTYGYVMKSDADGIRLLEKYTKKASGDNVDLVQGSKPQNADLSTFEDYSRMYGFITGADYRVLFIEESDSGKITGWLGSVDDVISYEDSNANYDEMVLLTRYQGGKIAAVVYR